jgi:MraZ protein
MFLGEFQHLIDSKGRVILPAKFRDELADGLVVTKGLEECLFVYTPAEWAKLEEGIKELPLTNKNARAFKRIFFSSAAKSAPDKQGRVLLPPNLRGYAGLNKDVVVIGAGDWVEIWDKDVWNKYSAEMESSYSDIAEQLDGLGI